MIGILVVSHGLLARELVAALESICGPQRLMEGVAVEHHDDMPATARAIQKAFDRVNEGDGVIIFTDLLGGTPSNVGLTFLNLPQVEVISGVNLPMMLKAASLRDGEPLSTVVEQTLRSGLAGITAATVILGQKANQNEPGPGQG
jgi:PTS system mannose-specific IIA component